MICAFVDPLKKSGEAYLSIGSAIDRLYGEGRPVLIAPAYLIGGRLLLEKLRREFEADLLAAAWMGEVWLLLGVSASEEAVLQAMKEHFVPLALVNGPPISTETGEAFPIRDLKTLASAWDGGVPKETLASWAKREDEELSRLSKTSKP